MFLLFLLPLIGSLSGLVYGDFDAQQLGVRSPSPNEANLPTRHLRAASRVHKLSSRALQGCLRRDHDLQYVDDVYPHNFDLGQDELLHNPSNIRTSRSSFVAQVGMNFKMATLLLEEIEHHTTRIACINSMVRLYFDSAEALQYAYEEFARADKFLLITSHLGCNDDGERVPYLVSEVSVHPEESLISLHVSRVPWKGIFNTMTLDFGGSNDPYEVRRHDHLRQRRQVVEASETLAPATAASDVAATTATQTATPTETHTLDISHRWTDTNILPPDLPAGIIYNGSLLPPGFSVKCKDCNTYGTIDIDAGSITVGGSNTTSDGESKGHISGYVKLKANKVGAHVELETSLKATDQLKTYTANLTEIALTPFKIPGIGSIGPKFVPALTAGVKVAAELKFTTGFDLTVPDGSQITIDVGDSSNSSQNGFNEAKITAIPFQAEASLELTVLGGFTPQVFLGASFLDDYVSLKAGAFLNLPTVSTTFKAVAGVNSDCEPANNSNRANLGSGTFDALINVDAAVNVGIAVFAEAAFGSNKPSQDNLQIDWNSVTTLTQTDYALPTACLSFDPAAKTFIAAAEAAATASGGSKPGGSNSGTSRTMERPGFFNLLGNRDFGSLAVTSGLVVTLPVFLLLL